MKSGKEPALSIGLPVYNGEAFLGQAIESLLDQGYGDFELIISDNASTDSTEIICRRYAEADSRIRYTRLGSNLGAAKNFNRVFEIARARYFKWAAHDDCCAPTYLERCIAILDTNPDVAVAHTVSAAIDAEGRMLGIHDPRFDRSFDADEPHRRFAELVNLPHFCLSIFGVIRREALARTRLLEAYVGSDRGLLGELGLAGKIVLDREPLFMRRDHDQTSVRRFILDDRGWVEWFDPAMKDAPITPTLSLARQYEAAIERALLDDDERARCREVLAAWRTHGRDHLDRPIADLLAADTQREAGNVEKARGAPT